MEQEGKLFEAIELYESAVKLGNLAEPIYRQWTLCLREHGEKAEALKVYRRCKEMLSSVLNRGERAFYCVDQTLPGERFVYPGAHALLQMSQRGARFAGFGGNNYDGQARCRRRRPHCTD